jgi:hypothetical protein
MTSSGIKPATFRHVAQYLSQIRYHQRSHSRVRVQQDTWLCQIRDSLNLEGQFSVFISPMNRVAQLYPQALGSLFVAYDLQG